MLPSFSNKKAERGETSFGASTAIPTPSASPNRLGRTSERASVSVVGPDLVIVGDLVSNGQVQVDGEVQGDIHGTHIVIGEGARITGGVVSEEVIVRGAVTGSIRCRKVMLQAESKVEGDIYHKSLAIEQGAHFEGRSRRLDDPLAGVQRPELPAAGSDPSLD